MSTLMPVIKNMERMNLFEFFKNLEMNGVSCVMVYVYKLVSVCLCVCLCVFVCVCVYAGWGFSMGTEFQFHSWRVFVLVAALPAIASLVGLTFMPESPRFLLEVRLRHTR